jgi:hypothetical protein
VHANHRTHARLLPGQFHNGFGIFSASRCGYDFYDIRICSVPNGFGHFAREFGMGQVRMRVNPMNRSGSVGHSLGPVGWFVIAFGMRSKS